MKKILFYVLLVFSLVLYDPIFVYAEGTYASELTGLPLDNSYITIKPIAVMVDNEQKALPHSGVAEADIVYELMNSTANGRITRLFCFYKNYISVPLIGSIRSVRTANIPIAAEYDAVLIHEGGPEIYVKQGLANPWSTDLNGGFSRIKNGKATEFTEFVTPAEVVSHAQKAKVSLNYASGSHTSHFKFTSDNSTSVFNQGKLIDMSAAFPHTKSALAFNEGTSTYDYYTYGALQLDNGTNKPVSFKNVILQATPYFQLDENGYMCYSLIGMGTGYYFVNGKYTTITWKKASATDITRYYDASSGKEIELIPGKTYVCLYPKEYLTGLSIK